MMKKLSLMLALTLGCGVAQAADYGFSAGQDFYQFSRTPQGGGLGLSLDYLKHKDNGSQGSAGLQLALPLGSLTLAGGGKLMVLDADGSATAALLGGRADLALGNKINLYGQAWYAPDSFASGSVKKVSDLSAGIRWNPLGPLMLEAGYRYLDVERSDSHRNRVLADGLYLGAGMTF